MNRLVKLILQKISVPVFTAREISLLIPESKDTKYALMKRAIANNDIIRIKRGLYTLSPLYRKSLINPFAVSNLIEEQSYISLETLLSLKGWIPEAVKTISSVTIKNSKQYDTPFGQFTYHRVPQKTLFAGVERKEDKEGNIWFQATCLKALCDYVYLNKLDWTTSLPLIESLRIEKEYLKEITIDDFVELEDNYSDSRVLKFIIGLKKELFGEH